MKRIVIVEDEVYSRTFLKNIITSEAKDLEIVGEAEGVKEAIEVITATQPDALLLDIRLKDGLSFEIFKTLNFEDYCTIFITSYDQYAMQAVKLAALDYVLKPINIPELIQALKKIDLFNLRRNKADVGQYLNNNETTSFLIIEDSKYLKLEFKDIISLESEGAYTKIVLADKSHFSSNPLAYYLDLLPLHFFQIHRSTIVNSKKILSFEMGRGGLVKMGNGRELVVAARRKSDFINFISGLD